MTRMGADVFIRAIREIRGLELLSVYKANDEATDMSVQHTDAEQQLRGFIAKFEPKHQRLIRSVRRVLRHRFPTAHELVYDNYNFFVIGYCSTERPSDCVFSIAAAANGVGLCFMHGARLSDPKKILVGAGK